MITYCEPHQAWLKTDRKQPSPCRDCAEAAATMRRAAGMRKDAEAMERGAELRVAEAHPPPLKAA